MKYILFLIVLLLASCSPKWHLKQAEKHLRKAEISGANVRVDTIYKTISVIVPETRFDTVVTIQNFRDTVTLEKDRIITKIKFDTLTKKLFVNTICPPDTVRVMVPYTVTKNIESGVKWWLFVVVGVAGLILGLWVKK